MISDRKFQAMLAHAVPATEQGCVARRKLQEWEARLSPEQAEQLRRHRSQMWESLAPAVVAADIRRGEVYLVGSVRHMVYTKTAGDAIELIRMEWPIRKVVIHLQDLKRERRLGEIVPEHEGQQLIEISQD